MRNKFYNGTIEDPFRPFSNGTEAMMWLDGNCDRCVKAFHPNQDKGFPKKESTMQKYVTCGKYCKLQYWIDIGFIEGTIPMEIAKQIGLDENGHLKEQCMFFSDNDNDGFKYPKRTPPDNTPNNQLVMPFILDEIGVNEVKQLEMV
jgi:hypothetical protein